MMHRIAMGLLAVTLGCVSAPVPPGENTHGNTPLDSIVDFGTVDVGSSQQRPLVVFGDPSLPNPLPFHAAIEAIRGEPAGAEAQFTISGSAIDTTVDPGRGFLLEATYAPTQVAFLVEAYAVYWFDAPDGGTFDRTQVLLRGNAVLAVDGG